MVTDLRKTLYAQLHRLGLTFFSNQRTRVKLLPGTDPTMSVPFAVPLPVRFPEALTQSISLMGSLA